MTKGFMWALFYGTILGLSISILNIYNSNQEKPIPVRHSINFLGEQSLLNSETNTNRYYTILNENFHYYENTSVADQQFKRVRILCWVMTTFDNDFFTPRRIQETWGKRCTILLFISYEDGNNLSPVYLSDSDGRHYLWAKTKESFKYAYEHFRDQADWFLKANDHSYVILENLNSLLNSYRWNEPIYFGCGRYKITFCFMYVLSKEALRRLIEDGLSSKCGISYWGLTDRRVVKCLEKVDVFAGDTQDSQGFEKFFPLKVEDHFHPFQEFSSIYKYIYEERNQSMVCCSETPISFNQVTPDQMYVYEYFTYHFQLHGVEVY